MKRLAITCFVLCCAWILAPEGARSQTATGPEQDCFGALPINRTTITQQIPYRGSGINGGEISVGNPSCILAPEANSVWYRLNVAADGFLAFTIRPTSPNDDYDFIVYRFPANATSQVTGCISALSNPGANVAACNFQPGLGTTGLETGVMFNSFAAPLQVRRGEVYMILVSNRNGNGGFTLDLTNTTPGVIPTTTMFPAATVSLRANQMTGCGSSSSLVATFTEPILRGSVQPSTFRLTGPNNQTFTVTSVACANCPASPNADSNTRQGVSYTLNFTPTISISGTYTLALSTAPDAVILRNVDNSVLNIAPASVIVNVGSTNLPTIASTRPIDSRNQTTFCLGQNVTLSTPDTGPGAQYQWLRELPSGALVPIRGATSTTTTITGSYAFLETPATDSSTVVTVTRIVSFRVRVTDGNGCTRTSNPIAVNVSPGLQARILEAPANNAELRICRNDGRTLTAEPGFASYRWYANFTLIDTSRSRTLFVRDGGTYAVETVDMNGCVNLSTALVINPQDVIPPVVRGDTVNCANPATGVPDRPIIISVTPDSTYRSYQWFDGNNRAVSGGTGASLSVTSGTFYLIVTSLNGCTIRTANFTVRLGTAPPPPTISNIASGIVQTLCPGSCFPLFGPEGFSRYQWYFEGEPIAGATARRYDACRPGRYAVQVFSELGCASAISMPPVTLTPGSPISGVIRSNSGSFTTCRGSSLRLSVTIPDSLRNRATIEWTRVGRTGSIGTDTSITVAEAGDYRVAVQFAGGLPCPTSSTVSVIVTDNPMPVVVTPTGGNTYCQGGSLTLDAGAFESYQWFTVSGGVSTAISGATMRTLVVRMPGTYSVRVTATGGCSGTSAPFTVMELPTPTQPIIGSRNGRLTLCPNGSLELFVQNADAALTYQWFRDNQAIAGATGTSFTVIDIGSYTVEARSNNGCTSRPNAPANVTRGVLPTPPSFPANITICPNADTTLVAPAGFIGYQWLSGTGTSAQPIMGETNRQFRVNRAGVFSLRVTDSLGCVNTSSTITVNQTQVVVRIDTIDAGVRFRGSSTPRARLFQWLLNGTNVPGATDSLFAPQVNGSYSVRVTDINGCIQTSTAQQFELPPPIPPPPCTTNCGPNTPTVAPAVRGDSAFAAPGDTVIFNVRLRSLGTIRPGARIDATICFNATLLEPLPPLAAGTITAGVRCIPLTLTVPSDVSASLFTLPFRAALGNDSVTALVLTSRLSPGGAPLPTVASYFRLTTISYAGGARLIGPPPRMRLTPSRPNPISGDGAITYVIENPENDYAAEQVTVTMSDVYGRVVKTLPVTKLIGKTGDISFSTSDLAPGVYFVTVRSERGSVQVQKVHVVR
ncbi:MAG: T9SS type A sorting domain-containing protein [Candidatus Kapabacteria bacterium]|nr:T9SS type A sorting domain-containing protein [Candidatus Kapabacteria bacterium]